MVVIATDNNPFWSAEAMVMVELEDVNDNSPVIVVSSLSALETSTLSVQENLHKEQFLAYITVFDADSGENGQVNCSLSELTFSSKNLFYMVSPNNAHLSQKRSIFKESKNAELISQQREKPCKNKEKSLRGIQQDASHRDLSRDYHLYTRQTLFDREMQPR